MSFRPALAFFAFTYLCACVPLPEDYIAPANYAIKAPVKYLDSNAKKQETAHFIIEAYDSLYEYADICERLYLSIMRETGLYSFVPREPYSIIIYSNSQEYHQKTAMPSWSGGAAYGNSLLLYASPNFSSSAAHEMTHLIFNEFMGVKNNNTEYSWVNEGLAVYMETKASNVAEAAYSRRFKNQILSNPLPFSQMINLAPQNESGHQVDRWYAQVWSVIAFMLQRGGSFNFSVFLSKLRDGYSLDKALADVYQDWKDIEALEKAWLIYINR